MASGTSNSRSAIAHLSHSFIPQASSPRVSSPSLTWSSPVQVFPKPIAGMVPSNISCPSASFCAAVDYYLPRTIFTSNYPSGGRPFDWIATSVGQGGLYAAGGSDGQISCPSISLCVASFPGPDSGGVFVSDNPIGGASAWRQVNIPNASDGFISISCPSTRFCAATALDDQGDIFTSTDGANTWSVTPVGNIAVSNIIGPYISCSSRSFCVIASGNEIATSINPTGASAAWTVVKLSPLAPSLFSFASISCPSASFCAATANVVASGNLFISNDPNGGASAWNESTTTDSSVSCLSASFCVAIDGQLYISSDPNGGASAWSASTSDDVGIEAVSCSSARFCAAIDNEGRILTGE